MIKEILILAILFLFPVVSLLQWIFKDASCFYKGKLFDFRVKIKMKKEPLVSYIIFTLALLFFYYAVFAKIEIGGIKFPFWGTMILFSFGYLLNLAIFGRIHLICLQAAFWTLVGVFVLHNRMINWSLFEFLCCYILAYFDCLYFAFLGTFLGKYSIISRIEYIISFFFFAFGIHFYLMYNLISILNPAILLIFVVINSFVVLLKMKEFSLKLASKKGKSL